MLQLAKPVTTIDGIGEKTAQKLEKLNISTLGDLLYHFPRRWEDFSKTTPISKLKPGGSTTIQGEIWDIKSHSSWKRKKMKIVNMVINDGSGAISAVWFNQGYIASSFSVGDRVIVSGKIIFGKRGLQFSNPLIEKFEDEERLTHTGRIIPIYPQTEGLNSKFLRKIIKPFLFSSQEIPDFLPPDLITRNNLLDLKTAIKEIHFPGDRDSLVKARQRLGFDELFFIQLAIQEQRKELGKQKAPVIEFDLALIKKFLSSLAFELTSDQKQAIWSVAKDIKTSSPMNRLLNGDVGSGKTVVAASIALVVVQTGYQVVLMAPTEILAHQHYETIKKLLDGFGVSVGLVTGKSKISVTDKSRPKKVLNSGYLTCDADIVVGTHALFAKKVRYSKVGLVVIDEQHRFGVEQRKAIKEKSGLGKMIPHFLSMTATPIPRSLALTLYGDLDVSIIKTKPAGRKEIVTRFVSAAKRAKAYQFVESKISDGGQSFVICSLIESDDIENERKTVMEEVKKMQKIFPTRRIGFLHGRMKSEEKTSVVQDFRDKKIDILVSTSVIEVGVDIPNANIVIIEDAERFGLAQLHQLRGRVGRSSQQSYCLVFSQSKEESAIERLEQFSQIADGFELSEYDLRNRGPGEFWGMEQSGFPKMKVANLYNKKLIELAKEEAQAIILGGIEKYPILSNKIKSIYQVKHFE